MNPTEAGRLFVQDHFPECSAAFLAGSLLRGEATPTSDLDLVVVTSRDDAPYRESFRELGWPIEAFVHTEASLYDYFERDVRRRAPSLPLMCDEGTVICESDGLAHRVQAEARRLLEQGPPALTHDEVASKRYAVTDLLEDLEGTERRDEGVVIATTLCLEAADFLLGLERRWSGKSKWALRALRRFDPERESRLSSALLAYVENGSKGPVVAFADGVLHTVGGRLFEGYYSKGS